MAPPQLLPHIATSRRHFVNKGFLHLWRSQETRSTINYYNLTEKDLSTPGLIFQIGGEPIRIDVLTVIDGVQFDEAWAERMISKFADQPVAVLSKEHLIKNKLASARTRDLADVEALKRKDRNQTNS